MPRVKTPRTNDSRKAATAAGSSITGLPEVVAASEIKKHLAAIPIDLESEIRRRAYELYEQRGRTPGRDREDWLVAEREVLARHRRQQMA